ncbi:MAG: hypothetical protein ACK56F_13540, partial [bacterium]
MEERLQPDDRNDEPDVANPPLEAHQHSNTRDHNPGDVEPAEHADFPHQPGEIEKHQRRDGEHRNVAGGFEPHPAFQKDEDGKN